MRFAFCVVALGLSIALPDSAGATGDRVQQQVQPIVPALDPHAPRADSPIAPLDRIDVTVFREPELTVQDLPVEENGRITLPLVGGVQAAGKTTEALAADIRDRLRQYVVDPQVSVLIKQSTTKRISVTGAVVEPGVFPLQGRMTLMQAVALARGPTQFASLDQAMIFRTQNGQRTAARFNLDAIARGKTEDPEVLPGDTIAVGSSRLKTAWRDIMLSLRSFNVFSVIP